MNMKNVLCEVLVLLFRYQMCWNDMRLGHMKSYLPLIGKDIEVICRLRKCYVLWYILSKDKCSKVNNIRPVCCYIDKYIIWHCMVSTHSIPGFLTLFRVPVFRHIGQYCVANIGILFFDRVETSLLEQGNWYQKKLPYVLPMNTR